MAQTFGNQNTYAGQNGHLDQSGLQGALESDNINAYADYFVSDGFHSIKCCFSEICKESFNRIYPQSVRIYNIVNMLICIQSYYLELRCVDNLQMGGSMLAPSNHRKIQPNMFQGGLSQNELKNLKQLEVVLVIDELRVISFDKLGMKMPSSVAYDELVRVHLNYLKHFLLK